MRKSVLVVLALGLAACGGGDDDAASEPADEPAEQAADDAGDDAPDDAAGDGAADDGATEADGDGSTGATAPVAREISRPQPPGQAYVAVDGQEFTLNDPGGLDCSISDEAITFGFRIGDNDATLGGGANHDDGQWFGDIRLAVANVDGQEGPSAYYPKDLTANSDLLVIDGDSAEYSGPMLWKPPNDGSNPPAIDIGDGIISVTC